MRYLIDVFSTIVSKWLFSTSIIKPNQHSFYNRPLIHTTLRMDNQQLLALYKAMDLAG